MSRGIIFVLVGIIFLSLFGLYVLQHGQSLLIKPPSEERIAFVSDWDGHPDIYTMKMDGSDKVNITNDSANDRVPVWSSDSMRIASVSDRQGRVYQLVVSGWNGRSSRVLTASVGAKDSPVWSEDGKEIMYVAGGKVFYVSPDGGDEEQRLPPQGADRISMEDMGNNPIVRATYSKDRDYLLVLRNSDFGRAAYAIETTDGKLPDAQEMKSIPVWLARELDAGWSPNSALIAVAYVGANGSNGLDVLDISTMQKKVIFTTSGDATGAAKPKWSPDGSKIVFEMWSVKDGSPDKCKGIYTVDASGGEPKQIVSGDAREPCWSSNGRYLVYALSRSDGKRDIWRVSDDGSEPVNLTQGIGDNYSPACPPSRGASD